MKKRLLCLLLALTLSFSLALSVFAYNTSIISSGSYENNIRWCLYDNGLLSFSGEGAMGDREIDSLNYGNNIPWYKYRDSIKQISIGNGITRIGSGSFFKCENLEAVAATDTLQSVGDHSFLACEKLQQVELGANLKSVGRGAFSGCKSLKEISFTTAINSIGNGAFYGCDSLSDIYYTGTKPQWNMSDSSLYVGDQFQQPKIHYETNYANHVLRQSDLERFVGANFNTVRFTEHTYNLGGDLGINIWKDGQNNIQLSIGAWLDGLLASQEDANIPLQDGINRYTFSGARNSCDIYSVIVETEGCSIKLIVKGLTKVYQIIPDGTYTFKIEGAPEITSQPQDYIGASGDTASFTVTATGEDLHYSWQYSDDDGASWNNSTAYDDPSASCLINNVTGGRLYRCLVSNSAGTVVSKAAQVMLRVPSNWRQRDQWTFTNSPGTSSHDFDVVAHGFYISSALYDLLRENLSPYDAYAVDFQAADKKNNTPAMFRYNVDGQRTKCADWGGSCYGMSVTAVLLHEGVLSLPEDFGQPYGGSISQVGISDEIRSRINFYHHQFALTATQNAARAFMEEMTVADQLKSIEAQVLSGHPVVLSYEGYDYVADRGLAHAVVVYDVETGPFTETSDGVPVTYQKKLCIYDCANPNNEKYDIYYTYQGDEGIWCLPGHNFISTKAAAFDADANQQAFPRFHNAAFELASNDRDLLNAVSLKDGSISAAAANAKLGSARLYALSDDQYSVTTSGGAIVVDGIRYTKTGVNGITAYIAAAPNYLADGSAAVSDVTVFLPEKSSYTVKSDEALSFGFADKGIATFADADSDGAITFRQTGGASVSANKSCDVSVTMLADSHDKMWDSVTVTAENGRKLDVVPTDSGAILTGDSLKGAVVEITDGSKTSSTTIDSDMKAADIVYQDGKITVKQTAMVFSDVPSGEYFYQPVHWAVNHTPQITNGTSPTTFSPNANCTRGQIVTFLWRAKGQPEPQRTDNPFVDVKPSDYYYKAVLWAVEQGITNGTDATHFSPNASCTRGQAVTFLWRAEGKPAQSGGANSFTDVKPGQYYYDAVLWAVKNGITNGTSPTTFSPGSPCTRGQIVTFLYRDMA